MARYKDFLRPIIPLHDTNANTALPCRVFGAFSVELFINSINIKISSPEKTILRCQPESLRPGVGAWWNSL